MVDIETLIIEAAHRRDLTYAKDFNGRAYALMDADWIGYFDTLDEALEFLGISVEDAKDEDDCDDDVDDYSDEIDDPWDADYDEDGYEIEDDEDE